MGVLFRKFRLVVVRHGEATHNLPDFKAEDLVLTDDAEIPFPNNKDLMPFLNNPLTEKGREQAAKLAMRLANEMFNLVYASDLDRAWDTAETIAKNNSFVGEIQKCQLLRERNAGRWNDDLEHFRAQRKVEEGVRAIKETDILDWRIPGGESVVDLGKRVEAFLHLLVAEVQKKKDVDKVLVVTHLMWMEELFMILSKDAKQKLRTPNTGLDQYTLTIRTVEGGKAVLDLDQVAFDIISCGKHLAQQG